jgi:hypothetical protein
MCNCIKNIEEKAANNFNEKKKFKGAVTKVEMAGIIFPFSINDGKGKLSVKTSNDLLVTVEGLKRQKTVTMAHRYCPFCGMKYDE